MWAVGCRMLYFVQLVHLGGWKISDTCYTKKSSGIYRARINGEGKAGRKRWTEDVELQRRQIPCAQRNGQTYCHSLVTISNFRWILSDA